jgi:CHASE2 domain-containing sensor protein
MRRRRAGNLWTTADLAALCSGLACLLAGVVLLAFVSGFGAMLVGICLLGVAGVAFVSLVFLLVGESEDREYGGEPR